MPTLSAIRPFYADFHLSPASTCSKCTRRVHLNSFRVCVSSLALQIHKIATSPTSSAIRPSYIHFHLFPVSTRLQIRGTNSSEIVSCLCIIFSSTDTQKRNVTNILGHTPPLPHFLPIPINSQRQHASKGTKRFLLNSFHVRMTFSASRIRKNSRAPTLSAIRPSYTHFPLFPMSTHLEMHETSSSELISCLCNILSPPDTRKHNVANILSHTRLLPHFLPIPCAYPPPNAQNEFF